MVEERVEEGTEVEGVMEGKELGRMVAEENAEDENEEKREGGGREGAEEGGVGDGGGGDGGGRDGGGGEGGRRQVVEAARGDAHRHVQEAGDGHEAPQRACGVQAHGDPTANNYGSNEWWLLLEPIAI